MRKFFLIIILGTTALMLPGHTQENASPPNGTPPPGVLQKFEGTTPQTTPAFTVPDQCEVRWNGPRRLNITVLADDGSIVAGAAANQGALYVPKGGNYHLQIDSAPYPVTPNAVDSGANGASTNVPPNNPAPPDATPAANSLLRPWRVEVLPMGSITAPSSRPFWHDFTLPTPAPSPADSATSPAGKLTDDQARALVLITGDNSEGTGFLIRTPDGPVVVTNIHVIANNPNLKITTSTGAQITMLSAKGASDRDLALLAVPDANYSYLEFSTDISRSVQMGDEVITPGNSQGGEVMLNTSGKVLGIGPERIEFDNPIYHGNSGGPVFHPKSNKVLGVVTEAMKVDVSNDLDKASFANRNSALTHSMRYFGLRLDTVSDWVPIDWKRFGIETVFLDQFHEKSRCLDAYLNGGDKNQMGNNNGHDDAKLYLKDEMIVKANARYLEQVAGADASQRIEALRGLLFDLQGISDDNMDQIQNQNNFYSFDKDRAQNEIDYRNALKAELDSIGDNVDRLSRLPKSNN